MSRTKKLEIIVAKARELFPNTDFEKVNNLIVETYQYAYKKGWAESADDHGCANEDDINPDDEIE